MSSKDEQSPSSLAVTAPPIVAPVTDVPLGARVHHFGELSEWAQHVLVSASPVGRLGTDMITSRLSRGDIVVFTDYVRVQ